MFDVAGIEQVSRLEEKELDLLFRYRTVLYTSGYYHQFSSAELDAAISKVDSQNATEDEEHLVLVVVLMPDELPFHLDHFDFLAVELGDDPGPPVLVNGGELLLEIDLLHRPRALPPQVVSKPSVKMPIAGDSASVNRNMCLAARVEGSFFPIDPAFPQPKTRDSTHEVELARPGVALDNGIEAHAGR